MTNHLSCLGKGHFAKVYEVSHLGKRFAEKVGQLGPYEVLVLSCGSKYVPALFSFEDSSIRMEIAKQRVAICPENAFSIIANICRALVDVTQKCRKEWILEEGQTFVHRDLKPENLAITDTGNFKILDWGVATIASSLPEHNLSDEDFFLPTGTPVYTPPESYYKDIPISVKSDSWAMGVILFQCLTGKLFPFSKLHTFVSLQGWISSMHTGEVLEISIDQFKEVVEQVAANASLPILGTVLKKLLEPDYKKRITPLQTLELLRSDPKFDEYCSHILVKANNIKTEPIPDEYDISSQ